MSMEAAERIKHGARSGRSVPLLLLLVLASVVEPSLALPSKLLYQETSALTYKSFQQVLSRAVAGQVRAFGFYMAAASGSLCCCKVYERQATKCLTPSSENPEKG